MSCLFAHDDTDLKTQDATLCHYAGYTEEEVEPLFMLMIQYLARPVTHEAFFKKYASKKFLKGMPPRLDKYSIVQESAH